MKARAAVINSDNLVVNAIVVDPDNLISLPGVTILVTDADFGPGWTYNGDGTFSEPEAPDANP